ncbi:hypothetical protein [Bradyrhizobium sp. 153]|uniref:hypothetical protein n=1 Tax=Bradyrhizobium sp. 153 TaxID=2782627 RepID=UPI001FF8DBE1|nr:hypothetical protein [Bradyrhizobium sp. 153]MCK1669403.1 hypothetical protein [Bradyrhizobium sp. 153]
MTAPFTEADFNGWRFNRNGSHFNGGSAFFGYGHRCIDQPRLLVIDKFFKRTRTTQRSYMVDGTTPCATLADALAALSVPPHPSEEQLALLRSLSTDWMSPDRRGPLLPLADMGLIEWGRDIDNKVTCRLTADGAKLAAEAR